VILARDAEPIVTRRALPGDPDDTERRYIEAAIDGVYILAAPCGAVCD
jgi:exodeoxyribonuclease III